VSETRGKQEGNGRETGGNPGDRGIEGIEGIEESRGSRESREDAEQKDKEIYPTLRVSKRLNFLSNMTGSNAAILHSQRGNRGQKRREGRRGEGREDTLQRKIERVSATRSSITLLI
jgi:hypothetical protein